MKKNDNKQPDIMKCKSSLPSAIKRRIFYRLCMSGHTPYFHANRFAQPTNCNLILIQSFGVNIPEFIDNVIKWFNGEKKMLLSSVVTFNLINSQTCFWNKITPEKLKIIYLNIMVNTKNINKKKPSQFPIAVTDEGLLPETIVQPII